MRFPRHRERPLQRPARADPQRQPFPSQARDRDGVAVGVFHHRVAVGHRDGADVELGRCQGEQQGQAIVNAGKSRIWGIEVDASIRPFEGLSLDLGYAYLNTKLKEINLPPTPPVYQPIFSTASGGIAGRA